MVDLQDLMSYLSFITFIKFLLSPMTEDLQKKTGKWCYAHSHINVLYFRDIINAFFSLE